VTTIIEIYPDGGSRAWQADDDDLPGYSDRKGGSIIRDDSGDPWEVTRVDDSYLDADPDGPPAVRILHLRRA
jgi:hypothetical protein